MTGTTGGSTGTATSGGSATSSSGTTGVITTTGSTTGSSGSGGTSGTTTGGAQADHSPVVIGNVSTTSGIAGGAQRPGVVGLQAWVQMVNANGGVNGHQIRLIARDDQADPSQNASYTQALVEQSHVLAFVSNWASQTQQASAGYLKSKQIPVVGGDHTAQQSWGVNPMFFPVASVREDAVRNGVAGLAKVAADKRNLGILVCAESAICTDGAKIAAAFAPKVGFKVVYNGSASFASPSYTAECLNMKNAGVQAVDMIFPASATRNVARDCVRQGLKVIYALANGTMEGDFNKDPNFEGSAVIHSAFPFSGGVGPVPQEYEAAMKKYQPNQISNPAAAAGFAAGVVFGTALAKVQGPVTTAKLLAALYTFKNDTFGGATIPLTYVKAPMTPGKCFFLSVIRSRSYVPLNGSRSLCV
ncbi:MAG: ABC transporter substrate-binding protein [Mycobacteriales bacterium]